MHFISPTSGEIPIELLTKHIQGYLEEDPKAEYRIVIGTDSQTNKQWTQFVTALIIHRTGKGARFFCCKRKERAVHSLHHRIYKETELSLQVMEMLKKHGIIDLISEWPIEVHLDIGKNGETRQLIQEVVGWVTSVGYIARIKPDAYGASAVADKYTKSIG